MARAQFPLIPINRIIGKDEASTSRTVAVRRNSFWRHANSRVSVVSTENIFHHARRYHDDCVLVEIAVPETFRDEKVEVPPPNPPFVKVHFHDMLLVLVSRKSLPGVVIARGEGIVRAYDHLNLSTEEHFCE